MAPALQQAARPTLQPYRLAAELPEQMQERQTKSKREDLRSAREMSGQPWMPPIELNPAIAAERPRLVNGYPLRQRTKMSIW